MCQSESPSYLDGFELLHFDELDSTNRFLKNFVQTQTQKSKWLCLADRQTDGYGQRARSWDSEERDLTFSVAFPLPEDVDLNRLGTLSPAIAVLLHRLFSQPMQEALYLKWPNDLWTASGKLAGILIETQCHADTRYLIMGIGVNVLPKSSRDYASSALGELDRQSFLDEFCRALNAAIDHDLLFDPVLDLEYWSKNDFFSLRQKVIVYDNDRIYPAQYEGLNAQGHVRLLIDGQIQTFFSSTVSIRPLEMK